MTEPTPRSRAALFRPVMRAGLLVWLWLAGGPAEAQHRPASNPGMAPLTNPASAPGRQSVPAAAGPRASGPLAPRLSPPWGQLPITPGQRDLNLGQQLLERRQQQQDIERALTAPPGTQLAPPPGPPAPAQGKGGHTVTLTGVDLDFSGQRPLFNVARKAAAYLDRPLDNQGVFELVRALTAELYERGYVTSNISLGQPAVVAGRLKLRVNWGRIKGWRIDGRPISSWREFSMVGWAMPNWRNAILNIRDIDQAIEAMNNGFKRVTVAIEPADTLGDSYLNLSVQRNAWMQASLGRDNSGFGVPAQGRDKYNLTLGFGDLLGWNDTLTLFTSRRRYADRVHDGEQSYDAALRLPLGYTRIDLQAGYNSYKNLLRSGGLSYQSAGNSRSAGLRVTRTVFRDATSQLSFYGALKTRQNKNYLAGTRLEVSSKHYSDATLGLQWSKQFGRHAGFVDLSWNRGLNINQGQYAAFDEVEPRGHVSRFNGVLSWQASFVPGGQLLTMQSQLGFQYSRQILLNSYQLTLGDEYTVRGYNRHSLQSGDRGFYLSNTLTLPLSLPWFAGGQARLAPFVGLDVGMLHNNAKDSRSQKMAGVAIGLRLSTPLLSFSATYSKPLLAAEGKGKTPVWYLNSTLSF
ncbi:ShlB/FhaC/HecB family hemolysin secretion/activation protein [Bordetella trematum]|uniref:ShlB/FhaC/HecB family hemolysin secretion/activation protein n=1 Tax=Bordetella trematum TaxID=123899 RepID=UPI000D94F9EF|nr:ShlB/FhaC/HecB family hemolysin secretion/activation protein [Bordetella trematum]SPU50991.1 hemolysin activator protein [Bordetella trematum]VDH07240.1 TpsB transporter [Bordetella trematum]